MLICYKYRCVLDRAVKIDGHSSQPVRALLKQIFSFSLLPIRLSFLHITTVKTLMKSDIEEFL
jgi:hypothetical protein